MCTCVPVICLPTDGPAKDGIQCVGSVRCASGMCQCGRGVHKQREDVCRQRSGSAHTTFRKEAERDRLRTWGSDREGLSPIERLGGARMCANSGRTHAETIQEVRRQQK